MRIKIVTKTPAKPAPQVFTYAEAKARRGLYARAASPDNLCLISVHNALLYVMTGDDVELADDNAWARVSFVAYNHPVTLEIAP